MNGFSSLCFILPQINAKNTAAQGITAMNTRIALIGIIVEDLNSTDKINEILHNYSQYIVGRMGLPYRSRNVAIISVIIDAPENEISALSGKLGMIKGVNSKVQYTKA